MNKVYVINNSAHDFSSALQYGTLHFLSEGRINRYHTNNIYRKFYDQLKDSSPDDYILITSLTTMNIIATCIMTELHHKINLLIHNPSTNSYTLRTLDFRKR